MKRLLLAMVAVILALALAPAPAAHAANPAPVQIFYVTLPEANGLTVMQAINNSGLVPASSSPVYTYFSIAIGVSGTYVYYDQWEDGYAADIANPTAAEIYSASNADGVQIWGNGVAADGCAPNINGVAFTCTNGADVLTAGNVIIPYNSVAVPNSSTSIEFDGRDKVGASASIAMARATWAAGSGTLFAFAHEMYATSEWGTAYEAPVGCNTTNAGAMFEYSGLSVMAAQNNTPIRIDHNGDGDFTDPSDVTITLNEGGSYLAGYYNYSSGCDYVRQGARVESTDPNKPIQVVLVTGDIGSSYESRDMNLLPVSAYGSSYWSPVGVNTGSDGYTPGPTRLFLYRPSTGASGPTHITCVRRSPTPTTVTQAVSVRGVVTVDLPNNSGAHCYASNSTGTATGEPIFGISTIDTDGQVWDWSYTLYPDSFLSTDALVGLGLGKDPTETSSTQNGSPLWVTPVCDTYVYVDWNNDGTADLVDVDGDGNATDTSNDGINETTSNNGMLITSLKSVRLFEPGLDQEPYDQSGARVWSRTASGVGRGGTPGCNLALAWGQDPRRASAGTPGLDVGTSIPPLRLIEGSKTLTLKTDVNSDGELSPGDVATYLITVKNTGSVEVDNVYVYDTVPLNTVYFTGTTEKDVGSGWTAIADDGDGDGFPLDVSGGVLLGDLAAGATFYVRFDVTLGSGDYEEVNNCDVAFTDAGTLQSCITNFVASRDWGDLPDTYGTTRAADGPRHSFSGLILGDNYDYDAQGQPSNDATGDDLDLTPNDEDGFTARPSWNADNTLKLQVKVTGDPGAYTLGVWIDWNQDGVFQNTAFAAGCSSNCGERYVVSVTPGANTLALPALVGFPGDPALEFRLRLYPTTPASPSPLGFVSGGEIEDYVYYFSPLAVTLASFTAEATGDGVTLAWETVSEQDNAGFNVHRAESEAGPWTQRNDALIPAAAPGSSEGHAYTWTDTAAEPNLTYWYMLEDVALDGTTTQHAPVVASLAEPNALHGAGLVATSGLAPAVPLAALGLALATGLALARRRWR